jgi:hypothetical protein
MNPPREGRVGRVPPAVLLLLWACACATTDDAIREEPSSSESHLPLVGVSELPEGRLLLTFPRVP